jgi:uncharacterized C2H2 Zn-finger protein
MSQRIVIECDECLALGEASRDAVTVEVRAMGVEVEVDLCDVHAKPLAEMLDRFVELGRRPNEAGLLRAACPRCGRKFASPQALGRHAKETHGESVNQMRGKAAPANPAPATGDEYACPDCGRGFATRQAIAVHRRRAHGVQGESKASAARRRAQGEDGAPSGE